MVEVTADFAGFAEAAEVAEVAEVARVAEHAVIAEADAALANEKDETAVSAFLVALAFEVPAVTALETAEAGEWALEWERAASAVSVADLVKLARVVAAVETCEVLRVAAVQWAACGVAVSAVVVVAGELGVVAVVEQA